MNGTIIIRITERKENAALGPFNMLIDKKKYLNMKIKNNITKLVKKNEDIATIKILMLLFK